MPERQYGIESTFLFPLVTFGSTNADFSTAALAFVAGDALLIRDGATGVQLANTTSIARIGTLGVFSAVVTASEMQMGKGVLVLIDQSSTKLWEDQAVLIETYGSTDGEHAFNRNSTEVGITSMAVGVITSTSFAAGAITSTAIGSFAISAGKIGVAAIGATQLAAGAITSVKFGAGAINSTAIADSAITNAKLGTGAISSTKIAADSIGSTQIADGALTEGKFASGALTTGVIADSVFDKIAVEVNTEVLDVLTVDTFGEPINTTSVPAVTATLENKISLNHAVLLNRLDVSTTTKQFYTSTGGAAFTKSITDTGTYIEQAAST